MKSALRWRFVLVVAVLIGSILVVVTQPLRLGLDLQGGTQIVLQASDTDEVQVTGDVMDASLEALRRRVDGLGVSEPSLQRSGGRRIIVELPGLDDPAEAVATIGRTGRLSFHRVRGIAPAGTAIGEADDGSVVIADEDGIALQLSPPLLQGADVTGAQVGLTPTVGTWSVEVDFANGGAWAQLTGEAACHEPGDPRRRVAIVLDGEVLTSPQVGVEVPCNVGIPGGTTTITGQFTQGEARELALLIRAGALPVPLEIVEQSTVGPSLGQAAIDASLLAALIGSILTVTFLIAYYRYLGFVAAIALGVYALVALAVLQAIGAVLTLPGIAGFVLAVGMAVDGNVLVFERVKEEHAAGRSLRNSARAGFERAFTAIADSNITTLIAGLLLYFFASGGVRGFGVTLSIGVITSMFSCLIVTRVLMDISIASRRMTKSPRAWGLLVGHRLRDVLRERGPNLVARRTLWLSLSTILVAAAGLGIVVRGVEYGLEFTGGRLIEYQVDDDTEIDIDVVRDDVSGAGFPAAVVLEGGDSRVSVRVANLDPGELSNLEAAVAESLGTVVVIRDEFVGPTIGNELRQKALIAVGLALIAQMIYLAIRFRWTYGVSAMVAGFQDVVVVIGVFAWLGKEFDGVFIAALLTVIGYSVNDSVVVFDRIRERLLRWPKDSFSQSANEAVLETLPRTIMTGVSTLLILVSLWFLGGETLADFALAMIIGIAVGTYSSVLTAMPVATFLERSKVGPRIVHPADESTAGQQPARKTPAAAASDVSTLELTPRPSGAVPPRPRKKRKRS